LDKTLLIQIGSAASCRCLALLAFMVQIASAQRPGSPPAGSSAQRAAVRQPAQDISTADTVSIAGRVTIGTGTLSSAALRVYVQTPAGGRLLFNRNGNTALSVGDSIEATGVATTYRGMPELYDARVRVVPGPRRSPAPLPIAFGDVPAHIGDLVVLRAKVKKPWMSMGDPSLGLISERDDRTTRAHKGTAAPEAITLFEDAYGQPVVDLRPFSEGDHLIVTGVVSLRKDFAGVPVYMLLPRLPSDVRVLGLTVRQKLGVLFSGLVIVVLIAMVAAWIFTLRRRVTSQTQELEVSESRYAHIFAESPAANFVSTPNGRLLACNEQYVALFGYASIHHACAKTTASLFPDAAVHVSMIEQLAERGRLVGLELELRRVDGSSVHVQANVVASYGAHHELVELHGFMLDITDRRRLETEFRQVQKMEAIGRLAGGVAHDFNNLLSVILVSSEFALESLHESDGARADLVEIRHAALRGAELTKQLLAFSRRQVLEPTLNDAGAIVSGLGSLLRRLVGESISMSIAVPATQGHAVLVDSAQLEQAIINLAVNAKDAMPDGGPLHIEVAEVRLDNHFVAAHAGSREGEHCCISVRDSGVGMDEDTVRHAFEPFFTTKGVGRGTGLGLSMVFGFVKQSGGYVAIDSAPGAGTTVSLYLPLLAHEAPFAARSEAQPTAPSDRWMQARGAVLLVEDEPQVRAVAARIIRALGFDVIEAADPVQAVAVCATIDALHLVLTDVVMPKGGGAEVARHVGARFPGVPFVFMSGYIDDTLTLVATTHAVPHILLKPFTSESLGAMVLSVVRAAPTKRLEEALLSV